MEFTKLGRTGLDVSRICVLKKASPFSLRDQWFESGSLQRGVAREPDFRVRIRSMIVGSLLSSSPSILVSNRSVARDLDGERRSGRRGRWSRALVRGRSGLALAGVLGVTAEDIRVRDRADREARVTPRLAEC
jgi:hypothetical protein